MTIASIRRHTDRRKVAATLIVGCINFIGFHMRFMLLAIALIWNSMALADDKLDVAKLDSAISINSHLQVYESKDHANQQSLPDDALFQVPEKNSLNFGFSTSSWWAKAALINSGPSREIYLIQAYPNVDRFEVLLVQDKSILARFHAGDRIEAKFVQTAFRSPAFKLYVPQGEFELYFQVKTSGSTVFDIDLLPSDHFFTRKLTEYVLIISALSIMFVMATYNLLFYLQLRKIIYLVYFVFVMSQAHLVSSYTGILEAFLPNPDFMMNTGMLLSSNVAIITALVFPILYLSMKKYNRKMYWIFLTALALPAVSSASIFFDYNLAARLTISSTTFCAVLILIAGISSCLARYRPAYFLFLSWSVLAIGTVVRNLSIAGHLPVNFLTQWSGLIGNVIEVIFISLGMSERIRVAEAAAKESLTSALNSLTESNRQLSHVYSQLEKVFYRHQIAKMKEGTQLEETMPTASGKACVICFDIIGSSKIRHIKAEEFFRNVFARCSQVMDEGYNGFDLRGGAYRIKVMGDGFLCSVGYPFASLSDNPANDAILMAMRFAQILDEEALILQSETPVRCGIGIALDNLTGFYPETGTKEYDLYGKAIVLATRYESMRKILFEGDVSHSTLIIQENVYCSIDKHYRDEFTELDLQSRSIVVRDDPAAVKLYYKILRPPAQMGLLHENAHSAA